MPQFSPSDFNKLAQRAGKNIDAPVDKAGHTLLHLAVENGDATATARLLRLGANPKQLNINGQTPLYAAMAAHDIALVKLLVQNGATFRGEDDNGNTPLQWAIGNNADVAFLEQLRDLGARLDEADSHGRTALHAAAAANNTDVMTWLLKNHAAPDAADAGGKTALHIAAASGAHDAMKLLLENGADPLLRDGEIKTPVYLAAERGDLAAVDALLAVPDVQRTLNERDWRSFKEGFSPLMIAVNNGHVAVAERLLDVGAYINGTDHKNRHSLMLAAENGTPAMVEMLIRRGADVAKAPVYADNGQTILHRLGGAHYKEKLLLLVQAGADINAPDTYGSTPLNTITESNDIVKVRALLDLGADPNRANNAGRRPLDRAIELSGYYDDAFNIAGALLAAGASPDIAPNANVQYAPLHTAARAGSLRAVKMLLDHGASADAPDRYLGATPWLTAVGAPSYAISELLRQKGADPKATDKTGRGVMHYAARSGADMILKAALADPALKAQVTRADTSGTTPLHDATKYYRMDCARLLLAAGADPLVYDATGLTPVHCLVRYAGDGMFPIFAAALAAKKGGWNVQSRPEKQTPLHIAARDGMVTSIDNLLRQDTDLTLQDSRGHTPLMTAVANEKTWAVRALIDGMKRKKAAVDAMRDNAGLSVLHLAVNSQYAAGANMTLLIEAGADVNARTPGGDTALHMAVARGRTDLVQVLALRGADLAIPNKAGATALDLARATNKQDIVAVLQDAIARRKAAQKIAPFSARRSFRPSAP